MERFFQRVVFGLLPADADAETHASPGKRIESGNLFRNQYWLALRQDQHLGAEADARRGRRDEAQGHERFHDGHFRWIDRRRALGGWKSHDDVIEGVELIEPDVFNAARQPDDAFAAFAVGDARKLDRELHILLQSCGKGDNR